MHRADPRDNQLSKKGSGRVAIFSQFPYLVQCYTLECSYAAGKPLG